MTVRVLIVDDQEPFRLAARLVVEATDGFDVVAEAETGEESVTIARDQEAVDRRVTELFRRMSGGGGEGSAAVDELKRLHEAIVVRATR